jgi:hypothetical protein
MPQSAFIRFKTELFDYQSQLPEEYNAGNRFYGRDVAEFLAQKLTEQDHSSDFLDEDWGWLIFGKQHASPEFEIGVYNLSEHGEGGKAGAPDWGLWVRAYERRKVLGLLTRRSQVPVPHKLLTAVQAAVRATGAEPSRWEDGPGDA